MDDLQLVRVLKALADSKRFRMLQQLAEAGELSCGQIGEKFSLSQPAISHHLKILNDAGLLVVRREAQHAFISVNRALVNRIVGLLPERLAAPDLPKSTRSLKTARKTKVRR